MRRFSILSVARKISIHAAREGGDIRLIELNRHFSISIHAAREGGDVFIASEICGVVQFQSTPPVKAATVAHFLPPVLLRISIHAAREGGDSISAQYSVIRRLFQSTPPVKAATKARQTAACRNSFQSTPPVKAATKTHCGYFSSRAYFNPRRP